MTLRKFLPLSRRDRTTYRCLQLFRVAGLGFDPICRQSLYHSGQPGNGHAHTLGRVFCNCHLHLLQNPTRNILGRHGNKFQSSYSYQSPTRRDSSRRSSMGNLLLCQFITSGSRTVNSWRTFFSHTINFTCTPSLISFCVFV
jgi:hypothetical protein